MELLRDSAYYVDMENYMPFVCPLFKRAFCSKWKEIDLPSSLAAAAALNTLEHKI